MTQQSVVSQAALYAKRSRPASTRCAVLAISGWLGRSFGQQGRRDHGSLAEPFREAVHDAREALAAQGGRVEEVELAESRRPEPGRREPDEPHRARHTLALEERERTPIQLEPVLRRLPR